MKPQQYTQTYSVLIIAPYPILPPSAGGKVRIVELAQHLSRLGLSVTILTPYYPFQRRHWRSKYAFRMCEVKYPFLIPFLFTNRPFPYEYLASYHPGYRFFIGDFLQAFDIYQFEHPYFSDLANYLPKGRPIVYDAHNVEHDYVHSKCRFESITMISCSRIGRLEHSMCHLANRILTCSYGDMRRMVSLYDIPENKFVVSHHGINNIADISCHGRLSTIYQRHRNIHTYRHLAFFSGSDVRHNQEAIQWICTQLAPRIEKDWAIIIHGRCARRLRWCRQPNVFLDVRHDGIEDYTLPNVVALNPVTQGAGANLKVLNYLAHGMPVITTPFGIRGYEDLRPFIRVCSLEEFAASLVNPPGFSKSIYPVLEKYKWEYRARELKQLYASFHIGTSEGCSNRP